MLRSKRGAINEILIRVSSLQIEAAAATAAAARAADAAIWGPLRQLAWGARQPMKRRRRVAAWPRTCASRKRRRTEGTGIATSKSDNLISLESHKVAFTEYFTRGRATKLSDLTT